MKIVLLRSNRPVQRHISTRISRLNCLMFPEKKEEPILVICSPCVASGTTVCRRSKHVEQLAGLFSGLCWRDCSFSQLLYVVRLVSIYCNVRLASYPFRHRPNRCTILLDSLLEAFGTGAYLGSLPIILPKTSGLSSHS